jgi:hypothetical protein
VFESDKTILAVHKSLDDENSGARGNGVQTAGNRQQKVQAAGSMYSLRQQLEAEEWQKNQDAGWGHMGWRGDPVAGCGSTAVETIRQSSSGKLQGLWGA